MSVNRGAPHFFLSNFISGCDAGPGEPEQVPLQRITPLTERNQVQLRTGTS